MTKINSLVKKMFVHKFNLQKKIGEKVAKLFTTLQSKVSKTNNRRLKFTKKINCMSTKQSNRN